MIRSFACAETEALFECNSVRKISNQIQRTALRKLKMIDAAIRLEDLKVLPANRLEKLTGNRKGQYSIRINNQWRICFNFSESDAWNVEIADYH